MEKHLGAVVEACEAVALRVQVEADEYVHSVVVAVLASLANAQAGHPIQLLVLLAVLPVLVAVSLCLSIQLLRCLRCIARYVLVAFVVFPMRCLSTCGGCGRSSTRGRTSQRNAVFAEAGLRVESGVARSCAEDPPVSPRGTSITEFKGDDAEEHPWLAESFAGSTGGTDAPQASLGGPPLPCMPQAASDAASTCGDCWPPMSEPLDAGRIEARLRRIEGKLTMLAEVSDKLDVVVSSRSPGHLEDTARTNCRAKSSGTLPQWPPPPASAASASNGVSREAHSQLVSSVCDNL